MTIANIPRQPCAAEGCDRTDKQIKGLCGKHYQRLTAKSTRIAAPPEERFWLKVKKTEGCWEWQGSPDSWGYGVLSVSKKHILAHRFSWELHYGAIPDQLLVCHHCDNPICVRPDHLFLGTNADNMRDMVKKQRSRSGGYGERHHKAKLSRPDVEEIKQLFNEGANRADLARGYGVSDGCIWFIVKGRTWRAEPERLDRPRPNAKGGY